MKRVTSYRLVTLAFCMAVALSVLLLVPATLNYLEFYVALSHMYIRINSFDIYTVVVGQLRDAMISANLSIVQNSSYVGLKVLFVDISVRYREEAGYSNTLFSRRFTARDASFGPHSSLDLIMANETSLDYFPSFAAYNDQSMTRGEPVKLLFSTDIALYMLGNPTADRVYLDDVAYQMPYYVS
jgi:hypothetical protein